MSVLLYSVTGFFFFKSIFFFVSCFDFFSWVLFNF
uniref:Uncharacterized protein n=1 Tax=Rhizophora mucronata TaxID=61149 RepID=A0A2P2QXB8_RHIMU